MNKKSIDSRYLVLPALILLLYLVYRLYDQSQILYIFPFDYVNDLSSKMAELFFLKDCGFHSYCPYWYNGITTFLITPPGWYFFTYPIYLLTGNVQSAAFISLLLTFCIAATAIFVGGRWVGFDVRERFFLCGFFLANASAIGYFVRLGRYHEFFGWANFLFIIFALLYYKDKELDWRYYLLIIPTTIGLLVHQNIAIFILIMFFSLLLAKRRQYLRLLSVPFVSGILVLFWWVPYIKTFFNTVGAEYKFASVLWAFTSLNNIFDNVAATVISLTFLVLAYVYLRQKDFNKDEMLFFLPVIILGTIFFLRLTPLIPILEHIYIDSHNFLFLFFILFFFLKINWGKLKKLIPFVLILVVIGSLSINIFHTAMFPEYDSTYDDIDKALSLIDGKYHVYHDYCETPREVEKYYVPPILAYGAIKYHLSSADGWARIMTTPNYISNFDKGLEALHNNDRGEFLSVMRKYGIEEIIVIGENCRFSSWGFEEKYSSEKVHLFKIPES